MSLSVEIKDSKSGQLATVTSRGQLVVAPLEFSNPYEVTLVIPATGYTLVEPVTDKQFVVTGVILNAQKSVSAANGAVIEIYTSDEPNSTSTVTTLFSANIERNSLHPITGLNIIISKGVWVNAQTDDATVTITLLGYYVVTTS